MSRDRARDRGCATDRRLRRQKRARSAGRCQRVMAGERLSEARAIGAQPTPSAKDRFLALTARSSGQSLRSAKGRLDPFAEPSANGRYLRTPDG